MILLEQNYRSTQNILAAANAVVSRNSGRKPKNLWSEAGDGPPITGYVADNEHDEAAFVAEEVDRLNDEGLASPGQVAVFYRTNAQSRVFEEIFIRVGLPYRVVGGVRFYERREVRDLLAYLRLIANPADEVSLRRVLNVPKRGIGDRAEEYVAGYAARERITFAQALRTPSDDSGPGGPVGVGDRRVQRAGRRPARAGRDRRPGGRAGRGGARQDRVPGVARELRGPAGRDPGGEPAGNGLGGARVRRGDARRHAGRLPRAGRARRRRRRDTRRRRTTAAW